MLKAQFTIMPKKRGNFLPRLIAGYEVIESDDLKLNPYFVFEKSYPLPGKIWFAKSQELRCGQPMCKSISTLEFNIHEFISEPKQHQANTNPLTFLNSSKCTHECFYCSTCYAFLDCRSDGSYHDYIVVFEEVAKDMIEAWDKAVKEDCSLHPKV